MASRLNPLLLFVVLAGSVCFGAGAHADLVFFDDFEDEPINGLPGSPTLTLGNDWVNEAVEPLETFTVQENPLVGDPRNATSKVLMAFRQGGGPVSRPFFRLTDEQQLRAANELVTVRFQHYQPEATRNSIALAVLNNADFDYGGMFIDMEFRQDRNVVNYKEHLNDFETLPLTGTAAWDDVEVVINMLTDTFSVSLNGGAPVTNVEFRYEFDIYGIDYQTVGSIFLSPATSSITGYVDNFKVFIGDTGDVVENADFDGDTRVTGADFLKWQGGFGAGPGAALGQGDANGDGAVNASDYGIWKNQFGQSVSVAAAANVPEPAGLSLVLSALAPFAVSRARRKWALALVE